ncbi:hypothetical protein YPPY113_3212, partial [Yersinia pestis PY-113]|jgi:hypothetical protein
MSVS